MSKEETYEIGYYTLSHCSEDLIKLSTINRVSRKICRKCYSRLPLSATVCRVCKNPDIRIKKTKIYKGDSNHRPDYTTDSYFNFDKTSKNKMLKNDKK